MSLRLLCHLLYYLVKMTASKVVTANIIKLEPQAHTAVSLEEEPDLLEFKAHLCRWLS